MHRSTALYHLVAGRFEKQLAGNTFSTKSIKGKGLSGIPRPEDISTMKRIIGNNDLVSIRFLLLALEKSKSVGRILVNDEEDELEGYGTGFLLAPNVLMTNAHVLPDKKTADHSQVEFNYEVTISGKPTKSVIFDLLPGELFITSPEKKLDYTIVAVNKKSIDGKPLSAFGFMQITPSSPTFLPGKTVSIIQHPNGERKQMALRNNTVTHAEGDFITYTTDTLGGSSGSPLFDDAWMVGGLHHSSIPALDSKGRFLTIDGKLWKEEMGDDAVNWLANEGIQMTSIVKDIMKRKLTAKQKKLLPDIFF